MPYCNVWDLCELDIIDLDGELWYVHQVSFTDVVLRPGTPGYPKDGRSKVEPLDGRYAVVGGPQFIKLAPEDLAWSDGTFGIKANPHPYWGFTLIEWVGGGYYVIRGGSYRSLLAAKRAVNRMKKGAS